MKIIKTYLLVIISLTFFSSYYFGSYVNFNGPMVYAPDDDNNPNEHQQIIYDHDYNPNKPMVYPPDYDNNPQSHSPQDYQESTGLTNMQAEEIQNNFLQKIIQLSIQYLNYINNNFELEKKKDMIIYILQESFQEPNIINQLSSIINNNHEDDNHEDYNLTIISNYIKIYLNNQEVCYNIKISDEQKEEKINIIKNILTDPDYIHILYQKLNSDEEPTFFDRLQEEQTDKDFFARIREGIMQSPQHQQDILRSQQHQLNNLKNQQYHLWIFFIVIFSGLLMFISYLIFFKNDENSKIKNEEKLMDFDQKPIDNLDQQLSEEDIEKLNIRITSQQPQGSAAA